MKSISQFFLMNRGTWRREKLVQETKRLIALDRFERFKLERSKAWAGLQSEEFYIRPDGVIACKTCHGNCGQCGNTDTLGNVGFDLSAIAGATKIEGYELKAEYRK